MRMKRPHIHFASAVLLTSLLFSVARNSFSAAEIVPLVLVDEVPLRDTVRNLARQMKFNLIFDPCVPGSYYGAGRKIREPEVSFRFQNRSVEEVFSYVLNKYQLVVVTNPATTVGRIVPQRHRVKPIPMSPALSGTNRIEPVIHLNGITLTKAIETLARSSGLKVVFDRSYLKSEYGQNLTTESHHWTNITPKQALAAILDNYDLAMNEETSGVGRIVLKAREKPDPHKGP